ncbi:nucleotide-diphospho-sugar transferase [Massariosphaeria phaeospora]|uniref:Nucleotide-diphospho-sugar transferase n=1 Tax=Massariosphaeria phaeospora TaxID=100035 RepID=A0A7C8MBF2_9PLEO|nr:nucleotide-diphospho-sugar transferase [Massariosphaeria phaeospora]
MFNNKIALNPYKQLDSPSNAEIPPAWRYFTLRLRMKKISTALVTGGLLLAIFSLGRIFELRAGLYTPQLRFTDGLALGTHQLIHGSSPGASNGLMRWSDFAYVQYVTNVDYLCNSVMILEALHRTGTKADLLMMYPEEWHLPELGGGDAKTESGSKDNHPTVPTESRLLAQARDLYKAKLAPITVQTFTRGDPTWQQSYTKLLAFNQTQYKRVISLDSDATVRQHMDELFFIPSSPIAMPRAYWLDEPTLSSQLVVLEPSQLEWQRIQAFMTTHEDSGFDMDILNTIYKDSSTVLPHRKYDLLTAEFRRHDHSKYLGSEEPWNATAALQEAKYVHFSDWPVPKPWLQASKVMEGYQPDCKDGGGAAGQNCTERDLWYGFYTDFSQRRQQICNLTQTIAL